MLTPGIFRRRLHPSIFIGNGRTIRKIEQEPRASSDYDFSKRIGIQNRHFHTDRAFLDFPRCNYVDFTYRFSEIYNVRIAILRNINVNESGFSIIASLGPNVITSNLRIDFRNQMS